MNVFYNTILFVKDVKTSKHFYESIIGLKVESEFDTIVFYENHFVIHDRQNILDNIFEGNKSNKSINYPNNTLIYFETDDVEKSFQEITKAKVDLIHPIKKQEWGQRVFRFYDPDHHIIEIGEAMHLDYLKK